MSNRNTEIESQVKPTEIKELTLEDLKRVRGGYLDDGKEVEWDDYNRDKCVKKV